MLDTQQVKLMEIMATAGPAAVSILIAVLVAFYSVYVSVSAESTRRPIRWAVTATFFFVIVSAALTGFSFAAVLHNDGTFYDTTIWLSGLTLIGTAIISGVILMYVWSR